MPTAVFTFSATSPEDHVVSRRVVWTIRSPDGAAEQTDSLLPTAILDAIPVSDGESFEAYVVDVNELGDSDRSETLTGSLTDSDSGTLQQVAQGAFIEQVLGEVPDLPLGVPRQPTAVSMFSSSEEL